MSSGMYRSPSWAGSLPTRSGVTEVIGEFFRLAGSLDEGYRLKTVALPIEEGWRVLSDNEDPFGDKFLGEVLSTRSQFSDFGEGQLVRARVAAGGRVGAGPTMRVAEVVEPLGQLVALRFEDLAGLLAGNSDRPLPVQSSSIFVALTDEVGNEVVFGPFKLNDARTTLATVPPGQPSSPGQRTSAIGSRLVNWNGARYLAPSCTLTGASVDCMSDEQLGSWLISEFQAGLFAGSETDWTALHSMIRLLLKRTRPHIMPTGRSGRVEAALRASERGLAQQTLILDTAVSRIAGMATTRATILQDDVRLQEAAVAAARIEVANLESDIAGLVNQRNDLRDAIPKTFVTAFHPNVFDGASGEARPLRGDAEATFRPAVQVSAHAAYGPPLVEVMEFHQKRLLPRLSRACTSRSVAEELHAGILAGRLVLVPDPWLVKAYADALGPAARTYVVTVALTWLSFADAWRDLEPIWAAATSASDTIHFVVLQDFDRATVDAWAVPLLNLSTGLSNGLPHCGETGWPANIRVAASFAQGSPGFPISPWCERHFLKPKRVSPMATTGVGDVIPGHVPAVTWLAWAASLGEFVEGPGGCAGAQARVAAALDAIGAVDPEERAERMCQPGDENA